MLPLAKYPHACELHKMRGKLSWKSMRGSWAEVAVVGREQALQAWSRAALPDLGPAPLDAGWLDDVIWDVAKSGKGEEPSLVQLDLNDASLIFEVPAGADAGLLIERSAADIVVRDPTVRWQYPRCRGLGCQGFILGLRVGAPALLFGTLRSRTTLRYGNSLS